MIQVVPNKVAKYFYYAFNYSSFVGVFICNSRAALLGSFDFVIKNEPV